MRSSSTWIARRGSPVRRSALAYSYRAYAHGLTCVEPAQSWTDRSASGSASAGRPALFSRNAWSWSCAALPPLAAGAVLAFVLALALPLPWPAGCWAGASVGVGVGVRVAVGVEVRSGVAVRVAVAVAVAV